MCALSDLNYELNFTTSGIKFSRVKRSAEAESKENRAAAKIKIPQKIYSLKIKLALLKFKGIITKRIYKI